MELRRGIEAKNEVAIVGSAAHETGHCLALSREDRTGGCDELSSTGHESRREAKRKYEGHRFSAVGRREGYRLTFTHQADRQHSGEWRTPWGPPERSIRVASS